MVGSGWIEWSGDQKIYTSSGKLFSLETAANDFESTELRFHSFASICLSSSSCRFSFVTGGWEGEEEENKVTVAKLHEICYDY